MPHLKLGLFLTNQQHLDKDMVEALDEQIAMVRHARDNGWDSAWFPQHYLNEGNNQQLQLVPFLARLAPEAGDMTIGIGIMLLNLHNPVYVAETLASLDIVTRGRLVIGFGLGYRDVEFDAFAVPRGARVARFEAYLELIKRLWTEENVSFEDPTCRLDGVRMNLRPVQRPHPPIWIAANNDAAVLRAARLGDAWFMNPHATLATIRRQGALYRAELARLGRPFPAESPGFREIYCARDRAGAIDAAGPYLLGKYRDYLRWGQDKAMPDNESFDRDLDRLLEDRFVLGSPEECFEQLEPMWKELGANHLILRTHWASMPATVAMRSMQLISTELLPALRSVAHVRRDD